MFHQSNSLSCCRYIQFQWVERNPVKIIRSSIVNVHYIKVYYYYSTSIKIIKKQLPSLIVYAFPASINEFATRELVLYFKSCINPLDGLMLTTSNGIDNRFDISPKTKKMFSYFNFKNLI